MTKYALIARAMEDGIKLRKNTWAEGEYMYFDKDKKYWMDKGGDLEYPAYGIPDMWKIEEYFEKPPIVKKVFMCPKCDEMLKVEVFNGG